MTIQRIVYAGLRRGARQKALHWYVEASDPTVNFGGFARRVGQPDVPTKIGTELELEETAEGRYLVGKATVIGAADVPAELVMQWQLLTEQIKVEDAKASAARRLAKQADSPLDEAIDTIRKALEGMTWHQRQSAIEIITRRIGS